MVKEIQVQRGNQNTSLKGFTRNEKIRKEHKIKLNDINFLC